MHKSAVAEDRSVQPPHAAFDECKECGYKWSPGKE